MPLVESATPIDELKSEVTGTKPRDEKGEFIKVPTQVPLKNAITNFFISHTGHYKDQDDLLDIKVGNPLGRIMKLLVEIKKQKAFSFTLKGSLGIAGVILTLSVFGIFGGSQILCEKGRQTFVGTIRELNAREIYTQQVPVISYFLELVKPPSKLIKNRVVLLRTDGTTLYIPFNENVDVSSYKNLMVFVTGKYNTCSQTFEVVDSYDIEKINN
jgi:hypothetical protein